MTNRAAYQEVARGSFVVRDAPREEPGNGEVLVKVHAAAIQPADAKVARLAMIPVEYPTVLGSPVAGTVEALGPGVSKVKVGERIVCGTKIFVAKKPKYGGLQRYSIVDESEIVEIGNAEFVKAVTLGSYTPPGVLFGNTTLNMHRPSFPASPLPDSEQGKKILIWGGSSAMGSLSISYAKQAGYVVISTSSPHNFPLLKSLGADHIFDHSAPETVSKIQELFPIDYWFDTISLKSSITTILQILAPQDKPVTKTNVLVLLPPAMTGAPQPPEGITFQMHRFSTHSPENKEWADWLISRGGYLEKVIKEGALQAVPPTVIGGLEKVEEGIDRVHEGVSGTKIVVEPWN